MTARTYAVVVLLAFAQGCGGSGPDGPDGSDANMPPASVGTARVVDRDGSPSSDCLSAEPCATIARAAEVAQAGDLVLIRPGTYAGDVVVDGAGTADRPIVFTAETPGKVIINGHMRPRGWSENGTDQTANGYVTWRGLIVRNHADGPGDLRDECQGGAHYAFRAARGWRIESTLVEGGQSGVRIGGHDVVIEGSIFQDLARYALIGTDSARTVIRDSIIRRINTEGVVDPSCGAVTKILRSDGLVFEGNQSYENVGPGFWLDWDNKNYVIRNNVLRNNRGRGDEWEGAGLWVEGNPDSNGKVYGNTFADNTGAGLGIFETAGVEVYENSFAGNQMGVLLRNVRRPEGGDRVVRHLSVHDNTFTSWTWFAIGTAEGSDWNGWSPETHDIAIEGNTYASDKEPLDERLGTDAAEPSGSMPAAPSGAGGDRREPRRRRRASIRAG